MFSKHYSLFKILIYILLFSQTILASSYSKNNLIFQYPSDWTVSDEIDSDGWRSIAIESGKSTSIFIEIAPTHIDSSLQSLSNNIYQVIKEKYKSHTLSNRITKSIKAVINGKKVQGLRHNIDVKHQDKKAVLVGDLYIIKKANRTILIQTEFWKLNQSYANSEFNMILKSLKF